MTATQRDRDIQRDAMPSWFGDMEKISANLARNWWVILLRGIFTILFGVIAVLMPGVTIASLVLLFAAYMLVDGVLAIASGVRAASRHERWGSLIFEGIVDLIAGAIAIVWPLATVFAFVYLLAAWAVVSGALLIGSALRLRYMPNVPSRWLLVFGGVVSVIWGILLVLWPLTGALVLTWWLAGYALFFGGALIVLAFRLHRRYREHIPANQ